MTVTSTMPTLPTKYASTGSGVPPRRFKVPSLRSPAMSTPSDWVPESRKAVATRPGR